MADLRGEVAKIGEVGGAGALDAALGVVKEEEEEMDLSKRTHILVLSERSKTSSSQIHDCLLMFQIHDFLVKKPMFAVCRILNYRILFLLFGEL